jgi:DNA-binding MarR family transcriptional regulator
MTHRLVQRTLQARIEPHGVTLGMWYFLRVLWNEDGLTQRELSDRIGTMEPTTMSAIQAMEAGGIVRRERNATDKRKINVFLTRKGRDLETLLLPAGIDVVDTALRGFTDRETDMLLRFLAAIQENLEAACEIAVQPNTKRGSPL